MKLPMIPSLNNMEKLFVNHGWTVLQIAEHFDLDPMEVRTELVDAGLEVPGRGPKSRPVVKQGYETISDAEADRWCLDHKDEIQEISLEEACSLLFYGPSSNPMKACKRFPA